MQQDSSRTDRPYVVPVFVTLIAIVLWCASCDDRPADDDDDDDVTANDDDTGDDDDADDDSSVDDDTGDDDSTPADDDDDDDTAQEISSCADIDISALGTAVAFQTQECAGRELFHDGTYSDEMNPPNGEPAVFEINNQYDFDDFLMNAFDGDYSPCEIDFESTTVLGTFFSSGYWNCSEVEICGLYDDGTTVNVVVFFHMCAGGTGDYSAAYHVVNTENNQLGYSWQIETKTTTY